MKKIKIVLSLIIVCVLTEYCFDYKERTLYITFVNKSDREIVCQRLWSGSITEADTLLECRTGAIRIDSLYRFKSGNRLGWETDFDVIPYIQFSVMDAETYIRYIEEPFDTIRKYVIILHRYQLTLEDLQRMNWIVVYPPEDVAINNIDHDFEPFEQDANRRAFLYFNEHVDGFYQTEDEYRGNLINWQRSGRDPAKNVGWNFESNPLDIYSQRGFSDHRGNSWDYREYKDPVIRTFINNLRLR